MGGWANPQRILRGPDTRSPEGPIQDSCWPEVLAPARQDAAAGLKSNGSRALICFSPPQRHTEGHAQTEMVSHEVSIEKATTTKEEYNFEILLPEFISFY